MKKNRYVFRDGHTPTKATFPVIDAHNHLWGKWELDKTSAVMNEVGVVSLCDVTANARIEFANGGYVIKQGDIKEFFEKTSKYPSRFYCFTMATFAAPVTEPLFDNVEKFVEKTIEQLNNVGINFNSFHPFASEYVLLLKYPSIFRNGILFAGNNKKGTALKAFFKKTGYCSKESLLKKALSLNPGYVKAMTALGDSYYFSNQYDQSVKLYQSFLKLSSRFFISVKPPSCQLDKDMLERRLL